MKRIEVDNQDLYVFNRSNLTRYIDYVDKRWKSYFFY